MGTVLKIIFEVELWVGKEMEVKSTVRVKTLVYVKQTVSPKGLFYSCKCQKAALKTGKYLSVYTVMISIAVMLVLSWIQFIIPFPSREHQVYLVHLAQWDLQEKG